MYSVVMLMALTTGGDTPAFGGRGCHGGSGCSGCAGYSCHGCAGYSCGGSSGCHGCHGRRHHRGHRCHGCSGRSGCHGCSGYVCGGAACHGCTGMTVTPPPAKDTGTGGEGDKKKSGEETRRTNAPATIVVSLPADARLSIEDQPTASSSSVRMFQSPTLPLGKEFYYTLKAEIVRDGQTLTATKQVSLRAGQESRVAIEFPAGRVASR